MRTRLSTAGRRSGAMDSTPLRIMIIDDASLARLYYRDIVERAGFAVEEALNGVEALEKLLVQPADLLIVDVNMPKMDGLTFLRTLRQHALPLAGIPALVMSTEAAPQDCLAARAAGANYYLIKPVPPDRLLDHVRLLCGAS
jgi:two-component system chemotaxis response regulator CheY